MTNNQAPVWRPPGFWWIAVACARSFWTVITLLVALFISGSVFADHFGTASNVANIFEQLGTLALAALGQTVVVLTGGIDLSVGAVISAATMLTSSLIDGHGERIAAVSVLVVAFGGAIGTINAFVTDRLKVHPLIVTLGMASVLQGACLLYSHEPVGSVPRSFDLLAFGRVHGIPVGSSLVLFLYVLAAHVLRYSATGRQLYAFGNDANCAQLLGISSLKVRSVAFGFSGTCAALAGIFVVSRTGVGQPLAGSGVDLASIAPVVLGGTRLTGGHGGVAGTFLGVLLITLLNNVLNFLDVSTYYQWIAEGMVILAAVAFPLNHRITR